MSYGTKDDRVLCIYASERPGAPSTTGSNSVSKFHQTRDGDNGHFNASGAITRFIRMKRFVTQFHYSKHDRFIRVLAGYREVGGDPIYGTKKLKNKAAKLSSAERRRRKRLGIPLWVEFGQPSYTIIRYVKGYTRRRRVPYYKVVNHPIRVKTPFRRLVSFGRKIYIPPESHPDNTPHRFNFSQESRTGLENSVVIEYKNTRFPLDYPDGKTIVIGKIAGVHAGADDFGTPFGTNEDFSDQSSLYLEELRAQSLYKMASNACSGIANLSNIVAEREGLKRTILQWALGSVQILLKGKKALAEAVVDTGTSYRKLSNLYLSVIYGLKPAISDFAAIVDELGTEGRTWRRYKGTAAKKWHQEYSYTNGPSKITIIREYKLMVKNQVMITGEDGHSTISNHGTINWLEAGWEVIPFSFVADWFIPIGNYLASQDLFTGVSVKHWHETVFYKEKYHITVRHSGSYGDWSFSGGTQVFDGEKITCYRVIRDGSPNLPYPQWKTPLSRQHGLNALFLLIANLRR
jgi:hypothetical protein